MSPERSPWEPWSLSRTRPQRSGKGGSHIPLFAQPCSVACLALELHFPLGN